MKPVVHGLEADYWNQIDFIYLDRDDSANEAVMNRYDFRFQPHFVFVTPEGEMIEQWFGAISEETFREAFDAYLAETGG